MFNLKMFKMEELSRNHIWLIFILMFVTKLTHEFEKALEMEPVLSLTTDILLYGCCSPFGMTD